MNQNNAYNISQAIALAGPGSALLSYFVVGIFVYAVVISL
jgi:amino acid permease